MRLITPQLMYGFGDKSITVYDPKTKQPITVHESNLNYKPLYEALMNDRLNEALDLIDENQVINKVTNGRVQVIGDKVLLDGSELHSSETKKLIDLVSEGKAPDRWFRFIEKLHANPSYNCRMQAYNFINHAGMCMTETGNLIGYKGVQDNFYSQHGNTNNTIIQGSVNGSGQILNNPGSTIEMNRINVDDNPDNGCSSGLHVGSHKYADSWAGESGKLLLIEYSPTDIVSVPNDCNHEKLRVCKYQVIEECNGRQVLNNGAYGHESNRLFKLWDYINHNCYGPEPLRIQIQDIQYEFPDTTLDEILSAVREHSDYMASVTLDNNADPDELLLNE